MGCCMMRSTESVLDAAPVKDQEIAWPAVHGDKQALAERGSEVGRSHFDAIGLVCAAAHAGYHLRVIVWTVGAALTAVEVIVAVAFELVGADDVACPIGTRIDCESLSIASELRSTEMRKFAPRIGVVRVRVPLINPVALIRFPCLR